jgi:hypothetical protein
MVKMPTLQPNDPFFCLVTQKELNMISMRCVGLKLTIREDCQSVQDKRSCSNGLFRPIFTPILLSAPNRRTVLHSAGCANLPKHDLPTDNIQQEQIEPVDQQRVSRVPDREPTLDFRGFLRQQKTMRGSNTAGRGHCIIWTVMRCPSKHCGTCDYRSFQPSSQYR